MLCLRYKPRSSQSAAEHERSASSLPASASAAVADLDALQDRIRVMRHQEETTYNISDYLLRLKMERLSTKSTSLSSSSRTSFDASNQQIATAVGGGENVDITCREKMGEWSYRIVDHFHGDREIVAISFNLLDRFLDECCCDRTAFKLAAITSLYLAIKMFSPKHVSSSSLADLSRGEFDASNIEDMEAILLKTLEFRLHGPTVKCFIDHMMALLPPYVEDETRRIIGLRAHFFAELSVLDYSLSIENPSSIAFAAIMNAAEGFENHNISYDACAVFIMAVENVAEINFSMEKMCIMRDRLWHLYETSEEFKVRDAVTPVASMQDQTRTSTSPAMNSKKGNGCGTEQSPVSVLLEAGCQLR